MASQPGNHPGALLESPVRRAIVDALGGGRIAAGPPPHPAAGMSAAALAAHLDRHVTTVRFHLKQLVSAGIVQPRDERAGVGRPKRFYRLADSGGVGRDTYRMLAEMLAATMASGLAPADGGAEWARVNAWRFLPQEFPTSPARTTGQWLAKLGAVVDLLDTWGHAPRIRTTGVGTVAEVVLERCPLADLQVPGSEALTDIHLGLIRGAFAALGESAVVVVPIPAPLTSLCAVRISTGVPVQKGTRP